MNIIMNHELVHLSTMDRRPAIARSANSSAERSCRSKSSRRRFSTSCSTTPRVAAPRWYHEGIAVFLETWMAGGLGRAQGGYDEMVFRSMVRDGTPLLRSARPRIRGDQDRFPAAGQFLSLRREVHDVAGARYSPEQVIEWVSRRPGSRAYYATQFRHVFGVSLETGLGAWDKDEHEFQQRNLEAIRKYPLTPYTDRAPCARFGVARLLRLRRGTDLRRRSTTRASSLT